MILWEFQLHVFLDKPDFLVPDISSGQPSGTAKGGQDVPWREWPSKPTIDKDAAVTSEIKATFVTHAPKAEKLDKTNGADVCNASIIWLEVSMMILMMKLGSRS